MNERIKELILEAGFPKFDERYVVSHGKELERFDKLIVLIVKECVDICYEIDKDYAGEDVLATWCADEIRKRFSEKPHFFAKEISERLRELNT